MQTDHFDAKNLKNEIVQKGSGVFDQLHSNPFDQVPALGSILDFEQLLILGGQHPTKANHQHIFNQPSSYRKGTASHYLFFESDEGMPHLRFQFAFGFHLPDGVGETEAVLVPF